MEDWSGKRKNIPGLAYLKECIQGVIDHYMVENVGKEAVLDRLEILDIQVSGLRDVFYLFVIDDILELKQHIGK